MRFAAQICRQIIQSLSRLFTRKRAEPFTPPKEPPSIEQQTEMLQTFQVEMDDCDISPSRKNRRALSRFLVASEFDMVKAKEMLLAAEQWRIDFGVDELVRSFKFSEDAEVQKIYPHYYHGIDKSGRPIAIHRIGHIGLIEACQLFEVCSIPRLIQHFVFEQERLLNELLPAAEAAAGHPVDGVCLILDLTDVTAAPCVYEILDPYITSIIDIAQRYYPETLGSVYHVKYPHRFSVSRGRYKAILGKRTLEKTVLAPLGVWSRGELLKDIDPDNLPLFLGGTCDCTGDCRK